ncbi:phenylacetaldoxime dehydratase family protein [Raoultella terrigena]
MINMVYPRVYPLRKPEGFTPQVQRWSTRFPTGCSALHLGFFAVQIPEGCSKTDPAFDTWLKAAFEGEYAPIARDHACFKDESGMFNFVVTAYWTDSVAFTGWRQSEQQGGWWDRPERLSGPYGYWREMLTVPLERLENLYWSDYMAALSKALPIDPASYSGYFGAMRDRIPLAACDPLDGTDELPPASEAKPGHRYFVVPPHNLAMIRSASFWGNCDEEQRVDYEQKLRDPLARGMDYLRTQPAQSGCCALRFQQTLNEHGQSLPETHAHAYFLSLKHMERWAEGHASHEAIFHAAIARYRKYGADNQLRTWHEVYVLPRGSQHFEYINCHSKTGLLPFFERIEI